MKNFGTPESPASDSFEEIRTALAEIQSDRQQTAVFLDEMLDGMESMRQQLESHEAALRERRDQLNRREADMRRTLQELEQRALELAFCEDDLRAARLTISQLEQDIAEIEQQRDAARQRLDAAADELASVADMVSLLDSTQQELVEAREQLVALKETVQAGNSEANEHALQAAIQEKEQLQADLRKTREEVQRLNERVAAQAEELASWRNKWSGDLGSMRHRLMERAQGIKQTASSSPPSSPPRRASATSEPSPRMEPPPEAEKPAPPDAEADSVIGSVLAQLADLEDD